MARYIKIFANSGEVQTAINNETLSKPYVAYLVSSSTIDYNSKENYQKVPLTFEILSAGTIYSTRSDDTERIIEYRLNNGEWTTHRTPNTSVDTKICDVVAGDKVEFRGDNNTYGTRDYTQLRLYGGSSEAIYNIYGNIMSLINSTNYSILDTVSNNCFNQIFRGGKVISAENLILPATTLGEGCYRSMFYQCSSLTTAPVLPATTINYYCYSGMFSYCTNLNYIKCLADSGTNTKYSYDSWVSSVASSGTFVKASGVNWTRGTSGIPNNWTVIEE